MGLEFTALTNRAAARGEKNQDGHAFQGCFYSEKSLMLGAFAAAAMNTGSLMLTKQREVQVPAWNLTVFPPAVPQHLVALAFQQIHRKPELLFFMDFPKEFTNPAWIVLIAENWL